MRIVAEVFGSLLIAAALYIGWIHIVKRWLYGPEKDEK